MSSSSVEKGRRGFFLAMAAGVSDAVVNAVSIVGKHPPVEPSTTPIAANPPAPVAQLRRRNAPPAAIPDVRADD